MSCHSLLAWRLSIERSAVILMGILFELFDPLCFSLAAFNICSLCLISINLINMCFGVFCLGFILFGTLWVLDVGGYFLPHFREVLNYYLLKHFLMAFLFVFLIWDSYDSILGHLTVSQRSLRLSSFLLILFSFSLSASFISTNLSSTSLILSSASVILL